MFFIAAIKKEVIHLLSDQIHNTEPAKDEASALNYSAMFPIQETVSDAIEATKSSLFVAELMGILYPPEYFRLQRSSKGKKKTVEEEAPKTSKIPMDTQHYQQIICEHCYLSILKCLYPIN